MNPEQLMLNALATIHEYIREKKSFDTPYTQATQTFLNHALALLKSGIDMDDRLVVVEAFNWLDDYHALFKEHGETQSL